MPVLQRRRGRIAGFAVLSILLAGTAASQQVSKPKTSQLRMLDARVNAPAAREVALAARRELAKAAYLDSLGQARGIARALDGLRGAAPGIEVRMSAVTGGPAVVGSRRGGLTAAVHGVSNEQIVRGFLSVHRALYGLSERDLDDLVVLGDSPGGTSGLRMLRLEQQIDGRPVFQSETRFLIDRDGRLLRTIGSMVPNARVVAAKEPHANQLEGGEAVVRLLASAGLDADPASFAVDRQESGWIRLRETAAAVKGEVSAREVYFPLAPGLLVQAWALVVSTDAADWYAVVDSRTGEILWRKDIRDNASAHDARFRVYVQADGTTPADSPAPASPNAAAPGAGTQFAEVAPSIVSMHTAMNATASPNGWIDDCPGGVCTVVQTQTLGNNVLACLDRNFDNACDTLPDSILDGNGRPTGNPDVTSRNRDFLGTAPRNFETGFIPPPQGGAANAEVGQTATGDGSNGTLPIDQFRRGSTTQQFYVANWYHDQLYELGFDEASGNFQSVNFGGQGAGNDRVLVDVADGDDFLVANDASFFTPPDGVSGRAQMSVWDGPTIDRDGGLDSEMLIHELTHGTSNRLVGDGAGLNWDPARGMGEGWSDFYALSLLNNTNADDPNGRYAMEAYVTYKVGGLPFLDNYVYGIRRFPYTTNNAVNPTTWADVSDVSYNLSGGIPPDPRGLGFAGAAAVHNLGEIWALTLWEVRSRVIADPAGANGDVPIGNHTMLELVTDGLKMTPIDPTFSEARDAILDADCATNDCANEESIWAGFADRGLGYGAQAPFHAMQFGHMGVVQSFDLPGLDVLNPSTDVTIDDSATNNNHAIDPGETLQLRVRLSNPWRRVEKGIPSATATLSTVTAGVSVPDNTASYPAIAALGSASSDVANPSFQISLLPSVPCGSAIDFTLTTTSSLGTTATTFTLRVGKANGTDAVVTYIGDPNPDLELDDASPRGVFHQQTLADDRLIADLDFRVDSLTHTFVGDLNLMLQAPNGLGIDLIAVIGSDTPGFGEGDNLVNTVIDDDQPLDDAHDMTQATDASNFPGPYVPIFNSPTWADPLYFGVPGDPVGNLGRFDGLSTKGTWSALAADMVGGDFGALNAWSIRVTPVHFDCTAPASMAPTALVVNPPGGNGVLEAGEGVVALQPTWTNHTGATVPSLTGAASNFTGPSPGPVTYTLTDATAAYGSIVNNASASCAGAFDCYGVSIAGSRPTPHWDATVKETLSTGTVKTWVLHVGNSFSDVTVGGPTTFYPSIETVFHHGVSMGCAGGKYCPTGAVTRQQLALLLMRAGKVATPDCIPGYEPFPDTPATSLFCPAIQAAAGRQIFGSCGDPNFCPGAPVTREQAAVYILRALEPGAPPPPACAPSPYTDVSGASPFCPWVQKLRLVLLAHGLDPACNGAGGNLYCPGDLVTRQGVSAMLRRAFALELYEP